MTNRLAARAGALAGALVLIAVPATFAVATPIAPTGPPTSLPAFQGAAATAKPIRGVPRTPRENAPRGRPHPPPPHPPRRGGADANPPYLDRRGDRRVGRAGLPPRARLRRVWPAGAG